MPPAQAGTAIERRTGALHIHSSWSRDGRDSLERLREFAVARRIGFLGLTDHAEDLDADRWESYVERCAALSDDAVRLLPGLEFRFAGHTGLHLLALGLTRWIEPRTPDEFMAQAAGHAGLTIVAHPILSRYRLPERVRAAVDAVEVWNASYNTRYLPDPRAIRMLRLLQRDRPGVVGIAGLDQHDAGNDREVRVVLATASDEPLAEIRAGRFRNVGRTMTFDGAVALHPARLGLLSAARWALDGVERVQERVARSARRSVSGSG